MMHTPGPWRVHSTFKECVVSDTKDQPYSTTIAECSGYQLEREANAILIATAPNLLQSLKYIVGYALACHEESTGNFTLHISDLKSCQETILIAEGNQS